MAVTRIKNNQITDNTIEFQKLKDGTLVGSKFNANITLNSNVSIIGNLQVTGNTTTINSINTFINDPLVIFNNGYVGVPSYDVGVLVNRNLATLGDYGSLNTAWVWSESDGAFIAVLTTETGETTGQINRSYFANIKVGNINAISANISRLFAANLTSTGVLTGQGNIVAASGTTSPLGAYDQGALVVAGDGGVGIGGNLNVRGFSDFIGNVTAGNIFVTGNINAIVGAVASQFGVFYGDENGHRALYAGVVDHTQLDTVIVQVTGNVDSYSQLNLQNVNNGAYASGDIVVTANDGTDTTKYIDLGIAGSGYDYPGYEILKPHDGYLNVATGNLVFYLFDPNKNMYFYTGGTTTTNEVGYNTTFPQMTLEDGVGTLIQPTTASVDRTTGALRVDGGLGVRGNIHAAAINDTPIGNTNPSTGAFTNITTATFSTGNIATSGNIVSGGNVVAGSGTTSTTTTTGALVVVGGAGISGDTNTGGNVNIAGQFVSTQAGSAVTGEGQIYLNGATSNRIDWAAVGSNPPTFTTRSVGTKLMLWPEVSASLVDYAIGIEPNAFWSSIPENSDSFQFKWYGGTTEVARLTGTGVLTVAGNVVAAATTQSTSSTTGALVVGGGAGIAGNLNVAGNTVIQGNLTVQGDFTTLNVATLDVEDLNITVAKGAANPAAANGAGLTVEGANATITYAESDDSWNFNKKVNFTSTATTILGNVNITSGNILNLFAGNFSSSNVLITGGNITNLTNLSSTNAYATNFSSGNAVVTGGNITNLTNLSATNTHTTNFSSGNVIITGGNITNLTNLSSTNAYATNFSSGNVIITGGNITNLTNLSSTNAYATNFSSGNVIITGGYIDGAPIGANVPSTGNFTTATTVNLNVTNGNVTTLYAQNFNSANAVITGGYADNYPIGVNVAAPGRFTTLTVLNATNMAGNLVLSSGTTTPFGSNTAGALILTGQGGAAVGGNVTIMGGLAVNYSATAAAGHDTIVQGANDSTLFWARPNNTYDQVLIGGDKFNDTIEPGAKLAIYSTDSLLLPKGYNSDRPSSVFGAGYDVAGMIRFSLTSNTLEYYDGTAWIGTSVSYNIISSTQFSAPSGDPNGNVDGVNAVFTLPAAATTNGVIVSINGVVQLPTVAYSIGGAGNDVLTFTEAPAIGDVIDVRTLITTSQVTALEAASGFNTISLTNSNVKITTGSSSKNDIVEWNTAGAQVNLRANVTVASSGSPTVVDSFSSAVYGSAEYTVTATIQNTNIRQMCKVTLATDGTATVVSQFGNVCTEGNSLVAFSGGFSGSSAQLRATTSDNNTILRIAKLYQPL